MLFCFLCSQKILLAEKTKHKHPPLHVRTYSQNVQVDNAIKSVERGEGLGERAYAPSKTTVSTQLCETSPCALWIAFFAVCKLISAHLNLRGPMGTPRKS